MHYEHELDALEEIIDKWDTIPLAQECDDIKALDDEMNEWVAELKVVASDLRRAIEATK